LFLRRQKVKNELRKRLFGIAGRYLGKEPHHGLPHVVRVYDNFRLLLRSMPSRGLDPALVDATSAAVFLHDIGYSRNGAAGSYKSHAEASQKICQELFLGELSEIQNQEWILYAVANHPVGLPIGPRGKKEIRSNTDFCLAALCACDHMDTLGEIGIMRIVADFVRRGIPWFPKRQRDCRKIRFVLEHPEKWNAERHRWNRWRSVVDLIAVEYLVTEEIIVPLMERVGLSQPFLGEISRRQEVSREFVLQLLKTKREKILFL
jgi:hypothetical protein